ncbi:MAG: hypothetical protein AB7O56_13305 [Bauldia sp.]
MRKSSFRAKGGFLATVGGNRRNHWVVVSCMASTFRQALANDLACAGNWEGLMSLKRSPIFVLPVIAVASAAQAADITPITVIPTPVIVPPPEEAPRTHVHIEGGPVFSSSRITDDPEDKFGDIPNDRGYYFGGLARHMFSDNMSFEVGAGFTYFRELSVADEGDDIELRANLGFQTYDLGLGYHPGSDLHTRLLVGLRVLHVSDSLTLDALPDDFDETIGNAWLYGPRIGFATEKPLGGGNLSLLAEVSASFLFGHAAVFENPGGDEEDFSGSRRVGNVEGLIGLGWHPSENVSIAIAYRGQQWWGLRQALTVDNGEVAIFVDADKFIHGPVIRLSLDF